MYRGEIDVKLATTILVGLTVVCQWHFILNIVHEMSTVLDIAVFRVWQSYRAGRTPIDQAVSDSNDIK